MLTCWGGGGGSPPNNLTLIKVKSKHFNGLVSIKKTGGINKLSEKNTSQGPEHATYTHSLIVFPPQIFIAR